MKQIPLLDVAKNVTCAPEDFDDTRTYYATADVDGADLLDGTGVTYSGRPSRANLVAEQDDILFAKMQATDKVVHINGQMEDALFSTGFFCLRPDSQCLDARFLFWILRSPYFHREKDRRCTGATQRALTLAGLREIKVPLPNEFAEQRRIAAILDTADGIWLKRKQSLAVMDSYLRSAFQHMFGDPFSNQHGLEQVSVEDLCEKITDCLHTTPKHFDEPNDYPSIRSSELQDGYIDLSNAKYVTEAEYNDRIQRYRPCPGDVIYCREGARFGSVGRVPDGMTPCLGQRTMLFKANEDVATPEYLWAMLRSEFIFDQAKRVVGGAASPHVNIRDIRKFVCLLPPMSLQRTFSQVCKASLQQREKMLRQCQEAYSLFRGLSQRAFHGVL